MNVSGYGSDNVYLIDFGDKLRTLGLGGSEDLGSIESFPTEIQAAVLAHIGQLAFSSQNFANLAVGKAALLELPRPWLLSKLDGLLKPYLDSNDDWDLALIGDFLEEFDTPSYEKFAEFCKNHPSQFIRDLV